MARPSTMSKVHAAVLDVIAERGPSGLSMEGIAARAGVGKQTLYRTWPTPSAILFDAMLARSRDQEAPHPVTPAPDSGDRVDEVDDVHSELVRLVMDTVAEMFTEPNASVLRALAAAIQTDPEVGMEYRTRLLEPQLRQLSGRVASLGVSDPDSVTELLMAPVFYRWFTRGPEPDEEESRRWVRAALAAIV
ncbi:TetR/AcrR family transcriptional regulator [Galactobacter sp.]|uniref:TetR/AcrR family transcriptional regulator n=1 Tax=Galactobacter sp. TaxID=2676125 RepID=UPI0025BCC387|nr:TetR/AcrR family transcriptional regulator [Galactobacter sp.]